ncbi:hypothetical protein SUNI508_02354 [Seiridium unicorne]|uniref:Erythromycin biosynthesis protein CIII-like C-terminal domain-containing protein n=1 Tax=Seiridium unicorne TaxID=138068 RepID=A0ABR2UIE9_9PEZI
MAKPNSTLPFLIFTAAPVAGHVNPLLRTASYLVKKGYEVLFLSTPEFKDQITRAGAEWSDHEPLDLSKYTPEHFAALDAKMPVQIFAFSFESIFLPGLPKRAQQLREALEMVHRRDSSREVVIFHEVGSLAVHPFTFVALPDCFCQYFGAPLPNGYDFVPKTICLGINPIMVDSVVTGFVGPGLPFEDTPAVRARNQYILDLVHTFAYKQLADTHVNLLREAGCTSWPEHFSVDDICLTSDVFLQLCGPSFDYPDPTRSPKIKFVGTLPSTPPSPNLEYPPWWSEVENAAAAGKKVVFLAQGSIEYSPEALLLPVIRALENESDILLVATIGTRGGSLPADFQIPKHTRILDYFPYDVVLQYADVLIFNAGYGGAGHAIGSGVPIVVLGELGQEKPEVAARIEYSGLGLASKSPKPEVGEIRTTVRRVLDNSRFKERALALQQESKDLDPFAAIEKQVRELIA